MKKERIIAVTKNQAFPPFSPVIVHTSGKNKGKMEDVSIDDLSFAEKQKFDSLVKNIIKKY
ncbi:hypothetical protein JYA35_14880 [Bacillus velezensis]|uniref:hypothetical protein n=1 Tax=Bacillus velezensis TaxID=492670 RepID=UPI0019D3588B|nr:hypothetical protein [Bacillus velezensis]MBN7743868.1 hypothetical protein [Bacillus velezensis]